ncbi:MAG TPA: hypothetical protein VKT82_11490 [Ktedonobacterales bacterium]|nr:hypothetical protein [Ktedonobacterales bacterium]
MSKETKEEGTDDISDLPPLPDKVITQDGQVIDITSSIWRGRASVNGGRYEQINWSSSLGAESQRSILTKRAWYLVKLYLADRLSVRNVRSVINDYHAFLAFSSWLAKQDTEGWLAHPGKGFDWSDFGESLARAFLSHGVNHTASKGRHFGTLRLFYTWGISQQVPEFSKALLRILQSIPAPGNLQGQHVRFRDAVDGPFSAEEKRAIKQALDSEQGTLHDRIIVRLFYELGVNLSSTQNHRCYNRAIEGTPSSPCSRAY